MQDSFHGLLGEEFVHAVVDVPKGHAVECAGCARDTDRREGVGGVQKRVLDSAFRESNLRAVGVPLDAHFRPHNLCQIAVEGQFKFRRAVGRCGPHAHLVERLDAGTIGVANRLARSEIDEQVHAQSLARVIHPGVDVVVQIQQDPVVVGQGVFIQRHLLC